MIFSDNSSPSSQTKTNDGNSVAKFNIFKKALNKGMDFFSKITNNGSPSASSHASTGSKCQSDGQSSTKSTSVETSTPSDCSSPDSLMTELIFFKPICREPKTPSSNKPAVIRVPSVRSNVSSAQISSPCPSPFFIPITPKRRLNSAFSFVGVDEEPESGEEIFDKLPKVVKPRASVKRKIAEISPPQQLQEKKSIKRSKVEPMPKRNDCRTTRSMYKSSSLMDIGGPIATERMPKAIVDTFLKPPEISRRSSKARPSAAAAAGPSIATTRVLRSRSFKH